MGAVSATQTYWFTNDDGSIVLPVAGDPTYLTREISLDYSIGNCAMVFLDGDGDPVTPTGGTVRFEASPIAGIWLEPPAEMTIDATTVIAASDGMATYTLPSFDGPVSQGRMILSGITGAVSIKAYHWRGNA